ncbi:MAG: nucleotidyltransferase family protein [Candidatus Izemoplasmatales bacterium]
MFEGIILAGGYSSRFEQNKMCVWFNGKPLILHTIETMLKVCKKVYVVTGYYHKEISGVLAGIDNVEIVYNKSFDEGMFSSVKAGVRHVKHDFFIIPGDYPLVEESTYKIIISGHKTLRVPSYNHRLGHPLFMKYELKEDLIFSYAKSLKEFRNLYDYEIVEVDDKYIHVDIDTIQDFNKINRKE